MKPGHELPVIITAAVITVSSTRTPETDESGSIIKNLLTTNNIPITLYRVVPDDISCIQDSLQAALKEATCIIFCGGTGLTRDDCTIEAISPHLQKQIDGFGELFRWRSYQQIGTPSILSRAIAGIINSRAVFCIPGSPHAAQLAVEELIIPEIRHIISHARR